MMNRQKSFLKHIDFILADYLIGILSVFLANWLRGLMDGIRIQQLNSPVWRQAVLMTFCITVSLLWGTPYKNILKRDKYEEIVACGKHTANLFICYIILLFVIHDAGSISRLAVFYTWLFYFLLEVLFRLYWKRMLRHHILIDRRKAGRAILLICRREDAEPIIDNLQILFYAPFYIKGIFLADYDADTDRDTKIKDIPVMGDIPESIYYSANHWVDEVIIYISGDRQSEIKTETYFTKMGITTHRILLKLPAAWHTGETAVERYGNYLMTTHMLRYVPSWKWALKRTADIVGSLIGLLFTGIIFIFVAPQIYHADKGPVIYTSTRIGKNGKPFRFYKFRSMYQDADARKEELMKQNKMQGLMFKVDNDPRILPGIGQFIRRTSLDEFPQFWNVLKGDMSLVGTRPPTEDEWKQYSEEHRIRMAQRPGITGIWQVSGRSNITDFNEVVKMDEQYIETWTLSMDFMILIRTIIKILKKDGAE